VNGRRAIIFYGSSPGTGKSTLSSFLFEQLTRNNIAVLWVYEDDVLRLPDFAEFVADILSGNPKMMATLLQATRAFVQECQRTDVIAITDSIYPCINWLISADLYTRQELLDFGDELESLLAPLNPLVVFLDADPRIALQRAIDQRGAAWFEGLRAALNGYAINRARPLQTLEEVADYFRVQAQLSLELLHRWSCDLLLVDAVQTPLAEVKALLLRHLGLAAIEAQPSITLSEMERYAGCYQAQESVPITNPLLISVNAGQLWVNTYWPNGSPLLVEGENHFRLESTSHRIHFAYEVNGPVGSLIYTMGNEHYRFVKVE
jgi:thymidylate kinase